MIKGTKLAMILSFLAEPLASTQGRVELSVVVSAESQVAKTEQAEQPA